MLRNQHSGSVLVVYVSYLLALLLKDLTLGTLIQFQDIYISLASIIYQIHEFMIKTLWFVVFSQRSPILDFCFLGYRSCQILFAKGTNFSRSEYIIITKLVL